MVGCGNGGKELGSIRIVIGIVLSKCVTFRVIRPIG